MSILSCRVLCLFAIVFCCVGVVHADAVQDTSDMYVKVLWIVYETPKLKDKCNNAGKAAKDAAEKADVFATTIKANIKTLASNPAEVVQKKKKGREIIKEANDAAEKARKEAKETAASVTGTRSIDISALEKERLHYESLTDSTGNIKFPFMVKEIKAAIQAVKDAEKAVSTAESHADNATEAAKRVKDVLRELDAAVAAEAEKKKGEQMKQENEKQVESQAQKQTKDTSLGEQQGQTAGNKTEQTHSHTQEPAVKATPLPTNGGSVIMGAHETSGLLNTVEVNGTHLEERHHIDAEESNTSEHYHAQQKKEEVRNSTDQRSHERSEAKEMTEDLHTPQAQTQQGNLSENETHSGRILRQTQYPSYPYSSDTPNLREMAANALLKSDALAKAVQQLDGSSSPALLRVPLLLLLLLSVLGCMAVC